MDLFTKPKTPERVEIERSLPSLIGAEWYEKLDPIYLESLANAIETIQNSENPYTPDIYTALKVFRMLSPGKVKVVICSQCPYPDPKLGDGIAFSCKNGLLAPSLKSILDCYLDYAGEYSIEEPGPYVIQSDLSYLVLQGVLLLNMRLTVEVGNPDSHKNIGWEDFIEGVFRVIHREGGNVPFCFWGREPSIKYSRELLKIVRDPNRVLTCEHPVSAAKSLTLWDCNHFEKLEQMGIKINWMPNHDN